jgi:hypothetical protein
VEKAWEGPKHFKLARFILLQRAVGSLSLRSQIELMFS